MKEPQTYSAISLLDKVLEFVSITDNKADWTFEKQIANPPRLIRLKQIDSLTAAFMPELLERNDIKTKIEEIISGKFIESRPVNDYSELVKQMETEITYRFKNTSGKDGFTLMHIQHNYESLISYKQNLNKLLRHNRNVMEISFPYLFAYVITDEVSKKIPIKKVDHYLSLMIDPAHRKFSNKQLVNTWNYPTEDLNAIDDDWW